MARGEDIDIDPPEDRPFMHKKQNVGHITGRPRPEPPQPTKHISIWPFQ